MKDNTKYNEYLQIKELVKRAELDTHNNSVKESEESEVEEDEIEEDEVEEDEVEESETRKKRKIKLFSNWQISIVAIAVFSISILFNENNNIIDQQKLKKQLEVSIRERDSLKEAIFQDSIIIDGINNSDEFLEKYAREQFYYRAEGEDVFIVISDTEPKDSISNEQ